MADPVLRVACGIGRGLRLRALVIWAIAAVLAAMTPQAADAQEDSHSGILVSLVADRTDLTVGDRVTLTLRVIHSLDQTVVIPRVDREWGPFELLSQTAAQTASNGDGTGTTIQHFVVTIFSPGTFEAPGLSISVRAPDGTIERVIPPPIQLNVRSVLSGPEETIIDIRPPSDLSAPIWKSPAALVIAGLAVLGVSVSVAYFIPRRRRMREVLPVTPVEIRPPQEIAAQEIERIERLDLPVAGQFKEHYALIAGAMHAYARAMFLEADRRGKAEMTTGEMANAIWRSSFDRKNARLLVDLLFETDLVRFSDYTPPASQANVALHRAREIVDGSSTPGEEAAERDDTYVQPEPTS